MGFVLNKAEGRLTLADWSLSSDGLEQKACVFEHFETKADDFLCAHNDKLTLLTHAVNHRTCMHAQIHTPTIPYCIYKYMFVHKLFSDTQLRFYQCGKSVIYLNKVIYSIIFQIPFMVNLKESIIAS